MNQNNNLIGDVRYDLSNKPSVSIILFLLFWLIKPFYIFSSGSFQIGDTLLILSFLSLILFELKGKLRIYSIDKYIFYFVLCVFVINILYGIICISSYGIIYGTTSFFQNCSYYLFNLICIITFRTLSMKPGFIEKFIVFCKINLLIQLAILITNQGKFYTPDRYMGTYNDPNQFGFAILLLYSFIYCFSKVDQVKHRMLYLGISAVLIISSGSMGMTSGLFIITFMEIYFYLNEIKSTKIKILYFLGLFCTSVVLFLGIIIFYNMIVSGYYFSSLFLARLQDKMTRNSSLIQVFLHDRNFTPFIDDKWNLLFGAGEGYLQRFGNSLTEIHSTWIGLWFYYGTIPMLLLFYWIKRNLQNINKMLIPAYIGVILEAFTLANQRQPGLWMLLIFSSCIILSKTIGANSSKKYK